MPQRQINERLGRWMRIFDWFEENPGKPYKVDCDYQKSPKTVRAEFYWARSKVKKDEELKDRYSNTYNREAKLEENAITFIPDETPSLGDILERSLLQNKDDDNQE